MTKKLCQIQMATFHKCIFLKYHYLIFVRVILLCNKYLFLNKNIFTSLHSLLSLFSSNPFHINHLVPSPVHSLYVFVLYIYTHMFFVYVYSFRISIVIFFVWTQGRWNTNCFVLLNELAQNKKTSKSFSTEKIRMYVCVLFVYGYVSIRII